MNSVKAIFLVQIAVIFAQPSSRYNCELEDEPSQCILAKECHNVRAKLKAGTRPVICGFNKASPKVCCPMETNLKFGEEGTTEEITPSTTPITLSATNITANASISDYDSDPSTESDNILSHEPESTTSLLGTEMVGSVETETVELTTTADTEAPVEIEVSSFVETETATAPYSAETTALPSDSLLLETIAIDIENKVNIPSNGDNSSSLLPSSETSTSKQEDAQSSPDTNLNGSISETAQRLSEGTTTPSSTDSSVTENVDDNILIGKDGYLDSYIATLKPIVQNPLMHFTMAPNSNIMFPTMSPLPPRLRTTPAALQVKTGCHDVKKTLDASLSPHARVARNKCYEYAKAVFYEGDSANIPGAPQDCQDSCHAKATSTIEGSVADVRQFPHMVLIGYGKYLPSNTSSYYCGGSLISENFVISAGHCSFQKSYIGMPTWVRLGELDLSSETESWSYDILIENIIIHPNYSEKTLYHDIALFKLKKSVHFSPDVRPACLKVSDEYPTEAIVSGWGSDYYGGWRDDKLKYVSMNLTSMADCSSVYSSLRSILPFGIRKTSQICAVDTKGEDACQGDSGGPLQILLTEPYCMYDIIGLTSFGKQCGNSTPGVYTRVHGYLPWIVEKVWPKELEEEHLLF